MPTITGTKWQPYGEQFRWACGVCSNCGSLKCVDCKCEEKSGFEFDASKYCKLCQEFCGGYREGDKYWIYKGERGAGKILRLEQMLWQKDEQLKFWKEEREYWKGLTVSMMQRVDELSQMYMEMK